MNIDENPYHEFKTLLKSYMDKAGFRSAGELTKQIEQQCRTLENKTIRIHRSTVYGWLNGKHVQHNELYRKILLCLRKILSIGSLQETNEFLESSGHRKLTPAEQQKEFPELPPPPAESAPATHSSVPEKPSTTEPEPSLDSLGQDESCPVVAELPVASSSPGESRPAEPEPENPPPVASPPVDPKLPEKLDSYSNFLLITSALLILGTGIFVIPQLYSPQSSEFSISILHPQNGQRCAHSVTMSGTVANIPAGKELWVIKEAHPGNYHPDVGPAIVKEEEWRGIAFIGNRGVGADTNLEFLLHIVLASHETGRQFQEYLDTAHKTGSWIGVPTLYDGKIVGSVKVIRDDSVICTGADR